MHVDDVRAGRAALLHREERRGPRRQERAEARRRRSCGCPSTATSSAGCECVTLDPNFASNGVFYLYYTKRDPDNPNTSPNNAKNRISRFQIDPTNPDRALAGSEVVVLDNIPADSGYHNGGAMVFGADGFMYVGTGEVGLPSIHDATTRAQDLSTLAGKILRINPRHGATAHPVRQPVRRPDRPARARSTRTACATRSRWPSSPART